MWRRFENCMSLVKIPGTQTFEIHICQKQLIILIIFVHLELIREKTRSWKTWFLCDEVKSWSVVTTISCLQSRGNRNSISLMRQTEQKNSAWGHTHTLSVEIVRRSRTGSSCKMPLERMHIDEKKVDLSGRQCRSHAYHSNLYGSDRLFGCD